MLFRYIPKETKGFLSEKRGSKWGRLMLTYLLFVVHNFCRFLFAPCQFLRVSVRWT